MPSPESWRHTTAAPWNDSFEHVTKRLAMPVGLCFLNDSMDVFNEDEIGFRLSPKTHLLIGELGENTYEERARSNKESITTFFAVNASGTFARR